MKKLRCVYNDGSNLEFTTDNASDYVNIDRKKLESVVLFDDDKILDTISFEDGYTFAYRMRSIGSLNTPAKERFIILGMVNKDNQILHFVDESGKIEVIDTPEEFARYGKLNLTEQESI